MKKAYIIGNGKSRIPYTKKICTLSPLYACNNAYKDFFVDYLFCKDMAILEEINFKQPIYGHLYREKDFPQYLNSGEFAVLKAIEHGNKSLELYGFDSLQEKGIRYINNVYAGTHGYPDTNTITSEDPALEWWRNIFLSHQNIQFTFWGIQFPIEEFDNVSLRS